MRNFKRVYLGKSFSETHFTKARHVYTVSATSIKIPADIYYKLHALCCFYFIYTGWLVTGGTSGKGVILREKRSRKYRIKIFRLRLCFRENRLSIFPRYACTLSRLVIILILILLFILFHYVFLIFCYGKNKFKLR